MRQLAFSGLLLKPIDLLEAPARGLGASLAADPDDDDRLAYLESEIQARWVALDEFFRLDGSQSDIWRQRAQALIARKFGLRPDDRDWWERLTVRMATREVPGFSVQKHNRRKRGAPREWTNERLAELFADIEYLKRTTGKRVQEICFTRLRANLYAKRWKIHRGEALRKAYSEARRKRRKDLLFALELSGSAATSDNAIDVAIELHSLKA